MFSVVLTTEGCGGWGFESCQRSNVSHIFKVLFMKSDLELNISKFNLNFQIYTFKESPHFQGYGFHIALCNADILCNLYLQLQTNSLIVAGDGYSDLQKS